jgi:hypothetical protein
MQFDVLQRILVFDRYLGTERKLCDTRQWLASKCAFGSVWFFAY